MSPSLWNARSVGKLNPTIITSCLLVVFLPLLNGCTRSSSIIFLEVPPASSGGADSAGVIQGRVLGEHRGQHILLYALADSRWWVQPFASSSRTEIAVDGSWKAKIHLDGSPEGYAVDVPRGLFFTNLEDKNETVVIDVAKRAPRAIWGLACDADGPRGISADARGLVYVACTDRVLVLDGLHEGATLGALDAGAGVDNIDWFEPEHLLYAAAGKAATLTVARVDDNGHTTPIAVGASVPGARNGVVDGSGNAYVTDPKNARLLVFPLPR